MAHHTIMVTTASEGALLLEKDPMTGKPSANAHKGYWAYDLEGGTMASGDMVSFVNNGKVLAIGKVVNFQSLQEYEWAAGFQMQCSRVNSVVFKWEDITAEVHAKFCPEIFGEVTIPANSLKVGDKIRVSAEITHEEAEQLALRGMAKALDWKLADPPDGEEQDHVL